MGGVISCGGDDDDGSDFKSTSITIANTEENLGAVATSVAVTDANIVTAEIPETGDDAGKIIITSKKSGETTVLAKATGYNDAVISVKVNASGAIEKTVTTKFVAKSSDDQQESGSETKVTSVSVSADSEEIAATGSTVLTATPTKTGDPTITYAWTITEGGGYAELSDSTSATVTLTGKSTDDTDSHDVTVSVTASDGTNTTEAATVTVKVLKVGDTVTAKVTAIESLVANPESIGADGETVLTATPKKSGEPTITYTWSITEGGDYAQFKAASTGATITLVGKNTDTTATHDVTVSVTASDGANTTEAKTVTVTVGKADGTVYFTKFNAGTDLTHNAEGIKHANGTKDDDDTWEIVTESGNSKEVINKDVALTSYDNKKFTARLALQSNTRGIKIKIGAGKTKIIRVDATNSKSNASSKEDATLTVGDEDWAYKLAPSTKYFSVTGDSDGWVSIVQKSGKGNILAIEVVNALVDTSLETLEQSVVSYGKPGIEIGDADLNGAETIALEPTITEPQSSTVVYTAKADGSATATAGNPATASIEDITLSYAWVNVLDEETVLAATKDYTASVTGDYKLTVSYEAPDGKTYSDSKTVAVTNSQAVNHDVKFEQGEHGTLTGTTEFSVEAGKTLTAASVTLPTVVPAVGYKFSGWKSSTTETTTTAAETAALAISATVTFTAQYEVTAERTVTWALTDKGTLSGTSTLTGITVENAAGYTSGTTSVAFVDKEDTFFYKGAETKTKVVTLTGSIKQAADTSLTQGTYAQIKITNKTESAITLKSLAYTHGINRNNNSNYGCQAYYYIGSSTDKKTLTASLYSGTQAELVEASADFPASTTVAKDESVTIKLVYYGGNNGSQLLALKDVVLTVEPVSE